jgi:hypothetical protein
VINRAATSVSLTSSPNPSVFRGNVTLTANVTPSTSGTPTGTVTFQDGSTLIGTGTLTGGTATITVSTLVVGSHSLNAVYDGDGNYASSSVSVTTHTVDVAPTTVSLELTPNPSTYRADVTLKATVNSTAGGTPTGTVTFSDGGVTLGTATLSGGVAVITTGTLSTGSHPILAFYGGDDSYASSTASSVTQVVNRTTSKVSLSSSGGTSTYRSDVTFTATVGSDAGGTPTGTVTFMDGSTTIGTGTLSGGTAEFTTNTLEVGSHSITAVYGGDSSYDTSTSSGLAQTVLQAATSVTVTSSGNPSPYLGSVTFTATVTPATTGTPTGTVTFKDNGTVIGEVALSGNTATFTTDPLLIGVHPITAVYGGDSSYDAGTSSDLTQTVVKAPTTVTVTSSGNPSPYLGSVTFTATVTPSTSGTPTGTVTFKEGSTVLGTGTLSGNMAMFTTDSLAIGVHPITAVYSGDDNYEAGTSIGLSQSVEKAATTVAVTSSVYPSSPYLGIVTFTATVTPSTSGTPTGTVTFKDNGTTLGTGMLTGSTATFTIDSLAIGDHPITAVYSGDDNYAVGTSSELLQTVEKAATTVTVASSVYPSSPYLGNVTFTATVTPATSGTPTGTVTFKDNGTTLGTGTLIGSTATFTTGSLAIGVHPITAVYEGDDNYADGTSSGLSQTVVKAATIVTVTSSSTTSPYLGNITFTATVTPTTSGTPTGTVTFMDGSTTLGTGAMSGNTATFTIGSLEIGNHTITAVYGGDSSYDAGTSSDLMQTVVNAPTTVTVTSSSTTSPYLSNVTFTATVAPSTSGTPTGTVTFKDNGTVIGEATLNVSSTATYTIDSLAVGSHTITAVYEGDDSYAVGTSSELTQTVEKAATTIGLTSSVAASTYRGSVTFTATVTPTTSGTPTGTVTFKDNGSVIGEATLSGSTATFTIDSLAVGSHPITAVYEGDDNYLTKTSSDLTQTVNKATSTVSVTSSVYPSTYLQQVTLTATVSSGAGGTPSGMMTFKDDGVTIGTGTLSGGMATLTTDSLAVGNHPITVVYEGDGSYLTSTSGVFEQTVGKAETSVTITSSTNPSTYLQELTFTASVSSSAGGTPGGTVTFMDGDVSLGTGTLSGGAATLTTNALAVGSHAITAVYEGDGSYLSKTSSDLTLAVEKAASTVGLTSSVTTSTYRVNVTFTATVSSPAGRTPSGTVTFKDDDITIGTGTLSGGTATLTTSALAVGSHPITAVYEGDGSYLKKTSSVVTQLVDKTSTTVRLTSSVTTSTYLENVTFTATVSSPAGGTPTGTVTFLDSGVTIGTGALTGGKAALTIDSLAAGSHSITAVYEGDGSYLTSASGILTQTVEKAETSVSVTSSANPQTYLGSVTFIAVVSSAAGGSPSGTVTFKDNGVTIGTGTLSGGTATFTTDSLAVGSHSITAVYEGDDSYLTSTSGVLTQTVEKAGTSVSVTSSANPQTYLGSVTFIAAVSSAAGGSPSGTVAFKDDGVTIGTGTLSGGTATLTTSALAVGSHEITAVYEGDASYSVGASTTLTQTVNRATITVGFAVTVTTSTYRESVTFTATVSSPAGGSPTGKVTFMDGTAVIGESGLIDGTATFTTNALAVASHSITAVYEGDSSYAIGTSEAVTVTVNKAPTTVGLVTTVTTATYRDSVTFTATVSSPAGGSPTGKVTFMDGTAVIGEAGLIDGTATFTTELLAAGDHTVTAIYQGDSSYLTGTSYAVTQTVRKASTSVHLSSTVSTATYRSDIILRAKVSSTAGGTPTGTFAFIDGTTPLGTADLTDGEATLTTNELGPGRHLITVVFEGDDNYESSTSDAVTVLVVDVQALDSNHDHEIHLGDIVTLIASGSDRMRDIDDNGVFDSADVNLMLQFITQQTMLQ